jgi:hypothetical protein
MKYLGYFLICYSKVCIPILCESVLIFYFLFHNFHDYECKFGEKVWVHFLKYSKIL